MSEVTELENTVIKESMSLRLSIKRVVKVISLAMGIIDIGDIIKLQNTVKLLLDSSSSKSSYSTTVMSEDGTKLYGVMFYGKSRRINGDCFFCSYSKMKSILKYRLFSITVVDKSKVDVIKNEFNKWFDKFLGSMEGLFDEYQQQKDIDISFNCCGKRKINDSLNQPVSVSVAMTSIPQSIVSIDFDKIKIMIGNHAESIFKNNKSLWKWYLYAKLDDNRFKKYIKSIHIFLHETFENPIHILSFDKDITYKSPNFEGWGVFDIRVKIFWNNILSNGNDYSECNYRLNFNSINNKIYKFNVKGRETLTYCTKLCYKHTISKFYNSSVFEKYGFKKNDEILEIDKKSIKFMDNDQLINMLESKYGEYIITILTCEDEEDYDPKGKYCLVKKNIIVTRKEKDRINIEINSQSNNYIKVPIDYDRPTNNIEENTKTDDSNTKTDGSNTKTDDTNTIQKISKKIKKKGDYLEHLKKSVKTYPIKLSDIKII